MATQRIEIEVRDGIAPEVALECVASVVRMGRISNDGRNYCFATTFDCGDDEMVAVITRNYRKNDCFIVKKDE